MLEELLGEESKELLRALDEEPVVSVRLNKRKKGAEFPTSERVPWCENGFYLKERPEFIFDPLLHVGAYYVQEAASMVYEKVVAELHKSLSPSLEPIRILDLCAAPGGKTTAMINALPDGCEIIANEYSLKRVGALKENLERWGYPGAKVTNRDSKYYASQKEHFDIIAVDAPCSGEGMMRKEEVARSQWSAQLVEQCSGLQKEILDNAVEALKPGGYLIYSTCTFNRKENEENAEYLFREKGLKPIDMNFPKEWNIRAGIDTDLPVSRFMPHLTKSEGLFLAVFRKPGEWVKGRIVETSIKKEETYPFVEVDKELAVKYLQRESFVLPEGTPKGLITITYKGFPLGPAKNIGSRVNNLYPKNKRILKR